MPIKLILLRHGETDYNKENRYDYLWRAQLTEKWKIRANELRDFFQDTIIDAIYSSPLQRAIDTVTPLAQEKKLQILQDARLNEAVFVDLQWLPYSDTQFSDIHKWNNPRFHTWETMQDISQRTGLFLEEIWKKHPWETLLVCSHVSPIAMLLKHIDKYDWDADSQKYLLWNGSLQEMFTLRVI